MIPVLKYLGPMHTTSHTQQVAANKYDMTNNDKQRTPEQPAVQSVNQTVGSKKRSAQCPSRC